MGYVRQCEAKWADVSRCEPMSAQSHSSYLNISLEDMQWKEGTKETNKQNIIEIIIKFYY